MGVKSQTIYARVSIETKSAVETYAENNGMTQAGAIERLISNGLKYAQQDDLFLNIMTEALSALSGDVE